jgi:sugar phosphate isomerase/epimerase
MQIGINLEFARAEGLDLEAAIRAARTAGYRFAEPYAFTPVTTRLNSHLTLQTQGEHYHVHTGRTDVARVRAITGEVGLAFSAVNAHATLLIPEVGIPYLRAAIDFAAAVGCPFVVSDEGPVPSHWTDLNAAFDAMCGALRPVVRYARSRGVLYAMELHNDLTARPEYLARLLDRFGPDELGVNFDTGNSFLAGNDPVEYARLVAGRVVHVHVKDIPRSRLPDRGKVTGTRVGVAAGDGVVPLGGVIEVLRAAGYRGVLSVECDTLAEARRSLSYLQFLLAGLAAEPANLRPVAPGVGSA